MRERFAGQTHIAANRYSLPTNINQRLKRKEKEIRILQKSSL